MESTVYPEIDWDIVYEEHAKGDNWAYANARRQAKLVRNMETYMAKAIVIMWIANVYPQASSSAYSEDAFVRHSILMSLKIELERTSKYGRIMDMNGLYRIDELFKETVRKFVNRIRAANEKKIQKMKRK